MRRTWMNSVCLPFLALCQLADKVACSRDNEKNAKNNQCRDHALTPFLRVCYSAATLPSSVI